MNTKKLLITLSACLLSGCVGTKDTIAPSLQVIDIPTLGETKTVELGDTLVSKGKIYSYEALRLENTVTAGDGILLKRFTIKPGILLADMRDDDRTFYSTDRLEVYDAMLGTQTQHGGLAISHTDQSDIKFFWFGGRTTFRPNPAPILVKTTAAAVNEPSFKQELIYNGRSGDTLKFLYREFSNDFLRAPFSQEIQYDLKDSATIGFKGVRIQVVKATNTSLTYQVLTSFPDAP